MASQQLPDVLLDLRAVSVQFGSARALNDCTLTICRGERVALVGSNGSGKSTLLRCLHGLVSPSEGQLFRPMPALQAMLFQRPYMLRLSVHNNVALGLWLRGQAWRQAKVQAFAALGRVGLAAQANRPAKALSGGQQQRLALARAWALGPEVLLLDEPTSSLDPTSKREVEVLMDEFAATGMTLIFSSHNLGQVKRLADRVIYLEQGRLVCDLSCQEFFNGPLPPEAEAFIKGETI